MSTVAKTVQLYAWKTNYETFRIIQGEVDSRVLKIQLFNTSGAVDLTNCEVMFYAIKPDSTKIYVQCEVIGAINGLSRVTLPEQICAVPGTVDCWVQVIGEGGTDLRFEGMNIKVIPCDMTATIQSVDDMQAFLQQSAKLAEIFTEIVNARLGEDNLQNKQESQDKKITDNYMELIVRTNMISSRIDILTSSDVSSDAEILDIRVGYDGNTYNSAGTAVRTQISNIAKKMSTLQSQVSRLQELVPNVGEDSTKFVQVVKSSTLDSTNIGTNTIVSGGGIK